jgi:hypothetical protein
MKGTSQRKYAPMGAAEIFSRKSHALFLGRWPVEMRLVEVWLSAKPEHASSPWVVAVKRTRDTLDGDRAEVRYEMVPTTDLVSMSLAEVVGRGGRPPVMHDVLLRRFVVARESERERGIELQANDEVRVRVSRGLFDTRKGPHQIYAVFGVVTNAV